MKINQANLIKRAEIITEALPYFSRYAGKTVVIKYGGNAMNCPDILRTILADTATLKVVGVHPILVHGGGPEINEQLNRLNIKSEFKNGLRVTSDDAMDVVQMALAGKVNKNIVAELGTLGVKAVGLCGKDSNLIEAEQLDKSLGKVGKIIKVNAQILDALKADFLPVIASIGVGKNGEGYNINADIAAGAIGGALKAEKLLFLTDADGILANPGNPSSLIKQISVKEIEAMIKKGTIKGGMLPKVEACISAIKAGITEVLITNGTTPHAILLELFTDEGIGTMITA